MLIHHAIDKEEEKAKARLSPCVLGTSSCALLAVYARLSLIWSCDDQASMTSTEAQL